MLQEYIYLHVGKLLIIGSPTNNTIISSCVLPFLSYTVVFISESCSMLALRCLALLFTPIKVKKLPESIRYVLKIVPVSEFGAYTPQTCLYPPPTPLHVIQCWDACLSKNIFCSVGHLLLRLLRKIITNLIL